MKGRLQTMHVGYSPVTLFKKKEKRQPKELEKGGGGGAVHKFYMHKAADKVIVASPKLFSLSKKHFSRWIGTY